MRKLTAKQIQRLDDAAINRYGISSLVLMENAGAAVARQISVDFKNKRRLRVCILCGPGNNGGDGFVAARHLLNRGVRIAVFLVGRVADLKPDAAINAAILQRCGCRIKAIAGADAELIRAIKDADVLVDALFGVGLNRDLKEPWLSIIQKINASKRPVLAVDVPSGLDATTGKIHGAGVGAYKTVTFTLAKTGFYRADGPRHCGKVVVADIGVPLKIKNIFSRGIVR